MKYRAEIDGLRAVAVIPVILFHAGISGFSGGYVGVDIFFVISGFLITTIIINELNDNSFSIVNFYERRARRILPALMVMLATTSIAAYILMPATLLKSYSDSVFSVVTFLSNVYFFLTNGYFSTASDEKPLLHTWSLAVEEQYYVFFPLLMLYLASAARWKIVTLLAGISVASLCLSEYLSIRQFKDANFYLITSRAWELLAGSLLAFYPRTTAGNKPKFDEIMAGIGLLLIIYSIIFYTHKTPFPGVYAIVPVLGAALIIRYATSTTLVGKLLSLKPFVWIGAISYSLYLWHQPLFAFLRMKFQHEPSIEHFSVAIVCTFILAWACWRYIETPFRNRKKYNRRAIFSYSIVALSFFGALGLTGSYFKGYENRFSAPTYPATTLYSPKRNGCHTSGANYLKPDKSCQYQNGNLKWAVFGDSHIVEPAYALSQQLESKGESLLHLSFSGCPPVLLYDGGRIGCTEWFRESLSHIQNKKEIENVLIGFRYTPFIYDAEHYIRKHPELFPEGNIDPREIYWKSLHEVIKRLQLSGKKVFVLFPIPELPVDIEKITTPFSIFHKQYTYDLANTIPIDEYEATNAFILDKLNQLPWSENLIAVKTIDSLCGDYYCPAIKNEKPLFFDSNHLSIYGGEIIAKSIMNLQ